MDLSNENIIQLIDLYRDNPLLYGIPNILIIKIEKIEKW